MEKKMEQKKDDGWARFNALLDVAEEEFRKYEKPSKKSREKERNLRRNYIKLEFPLKIEEENSQMNNFRRYAPNFEHQKGKRSDRKKKSSYDAIHKLPQLRNLDEENHWEMDCGKLMPSGNVIEKPSKRTSDTSGEEMPKAKKAKNAIPEAEPVMAIPEAEPVMAIPEALANSNVSNVDLEGPVLPENFKTKIRDLGGSESEITFVFQKKLTATDVNSRQSRLLIPFRQLKDHSFLTDEERELLEKRYSTQGENGRGVNVTAFLIDPNCNEGQMNLTRWDMGKGSGKVSCNYCLLTYWRKTVEKNGLKVDDVVHVWGFRKDSDLGLALVKV